MERRALLPGLFLLSLSVWSQEISTCVHFPSGNSALNDSGQFTLDEICATLQSDRTAIVIGHSDDQGTAELNQQISLERAQQVTRYLQCNCPGLTVRSILGAGGTEPIASNSTAAGRAQNRRVDIVLDPLPPTVESLSTPFDPLTQHSHRLVTPLMPAADKPRELHRVDASAAIEARMSDGTVLRIPAGALVDEIGNPFTGTVDLTYRSFLDPWEVVASGIPMHIAQEDGARHFETAGMYEVYASSAGKPVRLKEGTEMTLETDGPSVTADYGAYALDENTGTWQTAGRFDMGSGMTTYSPPSTAAISYNSGLSRLPSLPDSLTFLERQASTDHCYMTPCLAARKPYDYNDGKYRSPYIDRGIPAVRVVYDRRYWKDHHRIAFTVASGHRQHPEWRAFRPGKRWVYNGPMDTKTFRKAVSRKHFYQDIELYASPGELNGEINLKDRGTWMVLPIALIDPNNEEDDADAFEAQFAIYQKRLSTKANRFDRQVRKDLERTKSERSRLFARAYEKAVQDMDSTELAMDREKFDLYALTANAKNVMYQSDNASMYSRRPIFAVPSFGLWNCDRMVPIPLNEVPVRVLASNGKPILWVKAYGVPANGRAVITYWNTDGKTTHKMRLSPQCERIIFEDAERNLVVADVPAGRRKQQVALELLGRNLEQPSDRSMLGQLALGR